MVSNRWCLILLLTIVGALGACSSQSDPGDDITLDPSVEQLLTDASASMAVVESAAFTIEQSGADIFIDDANQLGFQSAQGRFSAPSAAEALITVDALGYTTEVGAIAIDGTLWFTNPLSGAWTEAPEGFTFDPATLFDADLGFPALLAEAATTAELIDEASGEDAVDGDNHHFRTTVAAERVFVLTGGLVTDETDADLWIDVETGRVVETRFDISVDDSLSSWRMTISDYDSEVDIAPPELGSNG